jgi:hypothetical protein
MDAFVSRSVPDPFGRHPPATAPPSAPGSFSTDVEPAPQVTNVTRKDATTNHLDFVRGPLVSSLLDA